MKKTFVLIGASRRVGKDTFAKLLERELFKRDVVCQVRSFANQLRVELDHVFNTPGNPRLDFWTQNQHVKEDIVRPMLIAWGMARRSQSEHHWVDALLRDVDVEASIKPPSVIILSDWRFPNELTRIRDAGHNVTAVYLRRPGVTPTKEEENYDPLCCDMADIAISNDGGLDKLQRRAQTIADTLGVPSTL